MHGIGCFDGMFVDWVVENNVIITDHWHGITFAGYATPESSTIRCSIPTANALVHRRFESARTRTARRRRASWCVTTSLPRSTSKGDQDKMVADHNLISKNPAKLFVDAPYDLHLRKRARAVDIAPARTSPLTSTTTRYPDPGAMATTSVRTNITRAKSTSIPMKALRQLSAKRLPGIVQPTAQWRRVRKSSRKPSGAPTASGRATPCPGGWRSWQHHCLPWFGSLSAIARSALGS